MERFVPFLMLAGLTLGAAQLASPQADPTSNLRATETSNNASDALPPVPPLPTGESTILGGAIRSVDPVLDRFTLDIVGQRAMRIYFDGRTQVFRDGKKIPVRDLGQEEHASVQTALDGTRVYALSVHILTQTPEGECRGLVRSYDPGSGKLEVDTDLSPQPVRLYVPRSTPIDRVGQPEFTSAHTSTRDLVSGTLVTVTFAPDQDGRGIAHRIKILAVPGSRFIFGGEITYLDAPGGSFSMTDSRNGKSYHITFDPESLAIGTKLHVGDKVSVTASYNGSSYVASSITIH